MAMFMHRSDAKSQRIGKLLILTATLLSNSFCSSAQAQSFVTGPYAHSMLDNNFDRFLNTLDTTGLDMADSYAQRTAIASRNHWTDNDADMNNLAFLKHFHDRTMEAQMLSINPLNQGISGVGNQGNNQANNGYIPGSLFGTNGWGNITPFMPNGGLGGFGGGGGGTGPGSKNDPFSQVYSQTSITPTFFPGYGGRVEVQQHTQQFQNPIIRP